MDNQVFVVFCPDYEQVDQQVNRLLSAMGGIGQFARPEERIALKVNLLQAAEPEKAITTHPALVQSVGRLVKAESARPLIVDSPGAGFAYNAKTLERVYRITGLAQVAEEAGIELNFDAGHQDVSLPEGDLIKRCEIITPVMEADAVINLCKLKTHGFMGMTGAVKNNFGAIPGFTKPGYHAKLREQNHFANMLLDLSNHVAPRLSIMDAVVAMEGDGPSGGTPRPVGLLLASTNPLALDVVAGEIIGLDRADNPVLLEAARRAMHPNCIQDVDLQGAGIDDLRVDGFELPATITAGTGFGGPLSALEPLFRGGFTVRPQVITGNCVACGACRDACPVEAITMTDGARKHAKIDDGICIRCYCCHEMCAYEAIELGGGILYRLFNRG